MAKPHKFEVIRLSQDHLHILNFFLDKKWSNSKKKYLLIAFLARIAKKNLNFEFSDRFRSRGLGLTF
jgi:hypothetical protein